MPAPVSPPPTVTPRADAGTSLGLTLPTVGLDRDTWGNITNANWTLVDQLISGLQNSNNNAAGLIAQLAANIRAYVEPIGSIKLWPTIGPPAGWWFCDGSSFNRTAYAELFALIGTSWGGGDGNSTFNVPDLRGCVPVMWGNWMPFGGRLGETSHVLSVEEMPVHQHAGSTDTQGTHTHGYSAVLTGGTPNVMPAAGYSLEQTTRQTDAAGQHSHNIATDNRGSSWGHNNIQPSVGISLIIKASHAY